MRSLVWHRIGYILFVTQLVVAVNVCAQNNPEISQFVQFNTIAMHLLVMSSGGMRYCFSKW